MHIVNIEFKARTHRIDEQEEIIKGLNSRFVGIDHQVDTYFNVGKGRLKLREGNIENSLIYYERENKEGSKESKILLYNLVPGGNLKEILIKVLGVKLIVDKSRKIYFIDNVKFHFDTVNGLGTFIEVEAIDETGKADKNVLTEQCNSYASLLDISREEFISVSYSDMLLEGISN